MSQRSQAIEVTQTSKATANDRHSTSSKICRTPFHRILIMKPVKSRQSPSLSLEMLVILLLLYPEHKRTGLLPSSRSSSGQRYFSSQQENVLIESGCNLEAILPSGTFENCSFTFNINSDH
jgi:hypothetical protein